MILLPQRPPQENLLQHTFDLYGDDIKNGVVPSSVGDKSRFPSTGRSFLLDKVDDYVSFPLIDTHKVELFFNMPSFATRQTILGNSTSGGKYIILNDSNDITITAGTGVEQFVFPALSINTWYKLTMIYDKGASTPIKVFIDDIETSSNNSLGGDLLFDQYGKYANGSSGLWCGGKVKDIKIWNFSDIKPTIHYKCEDTGLIAFDSSGNGNHGTKTNTDVLGANTFSYEGSDVPKSYQNEVGYSDGDGSNNNGLYIPRDESNSKFDVLGNPLQYKGQVSYPAHTVQSNCLLANGVDHSISFTDLTGISIISSLGTSTPSINGNSINLTAGTIYNIILSDGTKLACAEGGSTTLYPYEGTLQGTLVNGLPYTQQADDFDFNLQNGYSLYQHNTDTVANPDIRVPLGVNPVITNYTKIKDIRPSQRNHNGAETKVNFNPYFAPELNEVGVKALNNFTENNFYQSLNKKGESLFYSNLLSRDRIVNYMNYKLEAETIAYQQRVEADGGEVIDLAYVDSVYKKVKEFGVLANLKHWTSARAGIKKDVNNFISKTFSLAGNDGFQNTGSEQPVLSTNEIVFDGVDDNLQLSNNLTDFSFIQNTGVFTANVAIKLTDYTQLRLHAFLNSSLGSTTNKGLGFWYDNRFNQKRINLQIFKGVSGTPISQAIFNNALTDNKHTFTAQGDGNNLALFKDNTIVNSSVMGSKSTGDNTSIMTFGAFADNTFNTDGQSDNFYIFDTNLTQQQITELNNL